MKCPFCGSLDDRVIDSRASGEGEVIRRRRECQECGRRYTTYERVEEAPLLVLKKDMRREPFSRQKIMQGLLKAAEKRPISLSSLEEVVDLVERQVDDLSSNEVESTFIGEILSEELRKIDQVAYVRFASVYREFADVSEFLDELAPLVKKEDGSPHRGGPSPVAAAASTAATASGDPARSSQAADSAVRRQGNVDEAAR